MFAKFIKVRKILLPAIAAALFITSCSKPPAVSNISDSSISAGLKDSKPDMQKPEDKKAQTAAETNSAYVPPVPQVQAVKEPKPASSINPEKVKEAEALYEKGFEIYLGRKYDEAIKLYDKAIEADPGCYKAFNGKGIALSFKGNYSDGMELIKKALEIKPDYVYASFNMALAYKLKKDYNQALVWFNKALSIDSGDTWSYFGISTIYAEWNDPVKAVEYLKKAIETDPGVKEAARNEHDFDNIKNNPDFVKLLK